MATKKKKPVVTDQLAVDAADLRKKEIAQLSFDPLTAKAACRDGLQHLKPYRSVLARDYPGFELAEVDSLLELCDRTAKLQRKVQQGQSGPSAMELLPAAASYRRTLLPLAQSLATSGAVDAAEVRRIEKGSGASDLLQDVADLVELLTPLQGKVEGLLGVGVLKKAADVSASAVSALGKGTATPEEISLAADLRDRYATLIVRRHDRLRSAISAVTSWREADTLVPSLNDGAKKKNEPKPE